MVGLSTLTVAGLTANVTYYYRAGALNWAGTANFGAAGSSATLAPLPGAPAFAGIFPGSVTVSWTPVSSSGYELQASLNASFTPVAAFSSTTAGGAAGLTVSGLSADTTYFLRAGSVNLGGRRHYAVLGGTSTLAAAPVSAVFPSTGVFVSSATAQWLAVTSQGYQVEASTAADFGGDVISSRTPNGALGRLIDTGLDSGTTYYFRVGSLNWNGALNYALMGATRTKTSPKSWTGATNNQWNTATNWSPTGVPGKNDSVTINVANAAVEALTTAISFSSLTLGNFTGGTQVSLTLSTTVASGGDVRVNRSAGLIFATTHTIRLTGDLTLIGGSTLSHTANGAAPNSVVDLDVAGLFDLRTGATMTATAAGYAGGGRGGRAGAGGLGAEAGRRHGHRPDRRRGRRSRWGGLQRHGRDGSRDERLGGEPGPGGLGAAAAGDDVALPGTATGGGRRRPHRRRRRR